MLIRDFDILVVDDEALIRMDAVDTLSGARTFYEAAYADEALRVLDKHGEIMLVFTDVNMPGDMDGVALVAKVYETRPSIRWIVTSGREDLEEADLPDHASFLPKPYRQDDLLRLVARKLQTVGLINAVWLPVRSTISAPHAVSVCRFSSP